MPLLQVSLCAGFKIQVLKSCANVRIVSSIFKKNKSKFLIFIIAEEIDRTQMNHRCIRKVFFTSQFVFL